jgi:hypothetical protein
LIPDDKHFGIILYGIDTAFAGLDDKIPFCPCLTGRIAGFAEY